MNADAGHHVVKSAAQTEKSNVTFVLHFYLLIIKVKIHYVLSISLAWDGLVGLPMISFS